MRTLPNVTGALVGFLSTAVGVPFTTQVPAQRPAEFGLVTATGGGVRNLAQASPTFAIELWAGSSARAYELARAAWSALDDADQLSVEVWVAAASLTLPVDYPDPATKNPRWVFVFSPTINLGVTS